jgi:hypothetical protein
MKGLVAEIYISRDRMAPMLSLNTIRVAAFWRASALIGRQL